MNNDKHSPSTKSDVCPPSFSGVVWACIGGADNVDRRTHDAEIARMIQLNGLVAFDPEMLDFD